MRSARTYRSCLFLGGGPVEGWQTVADDLHTYDALAVPMARAQAFRTPYDPYKLCERAERVLYDRHHFDSRALTGRTLEVVIADGWLLPRTAEQDGVDLFVRRGHEPAVQTIAEEVFWHTRGVRITGPWDRP